MVQKLANEIFHNLSGRDDFLERGMDGFKGDKNI
jgi:hypothetical protein